MSRIQALAWIADIARLERNGIEASYLRVRNFTAGRSVWAVIVASVLLGSGDKFRANGLARDRVIRGRTKKVYGVVFRGW